VTRNQQRAVELADAILTRKLPPSAVTETEWALLLLAADLCNELSPAMFVAGRVLEHFDGRRGFFATAGSSGAWHDHLSELAGWQVVGLN